MALLAVVAGTGACTPVRTLTGEHCRNGLDDDLDGRVDCRDSDCARELACTLDAPFDPELPAWLGGDEGGPDLGASFESACDPAAADDRAVYAVGCSLLPDDCGDGLRCVPLTVEGVVLETGCVRRGCAAPLSGCRRIDDAGWQTVADRCGTATQCMSFDDVDGGVLRCRPLCVIGDGAMGSCMDCRAMAKLFVVDEAAEQSVQGLGVCADPP